MPFKNLLINGAKELGLNLSNAQTESFLTYLKELISWNEKVNLTAITQEKEIIVRHFLDSLTLSKVFSFAQKDLKVIDVGSGAGFPGIPLKIVFPYIQITLVEATTKKTDFLDHLISKLNLALVKIVNERAEKLGQNKLYRGDYDVSLSRAVAELSTLCEYCLPFLKVGGIFIAQKGKDIKAELEKARNAITTLGGKVKNIQRLNLPPTKEPRSLIVIEKISETPEKYPRKVGIPKKRPL